ncbi:hypothetical protein GOP47_0017757 [Adiantum capillus-veneris]|uniref:Uncharacterized protein n=1 Tax=Adiantum capillus-veneris TaxID=13818 RepID=A0A9D4UGY8_ADICA|nr:hypothetical protein GOP47_0017757 [Adiantum capillus-veneris]
MSSPCPAALMCHEHAMNCGMLLSKVAFSAPPYCCRVKMNSSDHFMRFANLSTSEQFMGRVVQITACTTFSTSDHFTGPVESP